VFLVEDPLHDLRWDVVLKTTDEAICKLFIAVVKTLPIIKANGATWVLDGDTNRWNLTEKIDGIIPMIMAKTKESIKSFDTDALLISHVQKLATGIKKEEFMLKIAGYQYAKNISSLLNTMVKGNDETLDLLLGNAHLLLFKDGTYDLRDGF